MILERVIRGLTLQRRAHDPTDFWFTPIGTTLPNDAGMVVNAETSIRLTTVYACVRVIAEALASIPLVAYERKPQGKRRATDHRYWPTFASAPNEEMTKFTWIELMLVHLLLWGNSFSEIKRPPGGHDGSGLQRSPLKPGTVRPMKQDNGRLAYEVADEKTGERRLSGAADLIHVPGIYVDRMVRIPEDGIWV